MHNIWGLHYNDLIMSAIASQITSLTIVYSTVYTGANQRKHQSSASLAFVRGIHRGPVNSPHKWPVTRKMFPFDDVIMVWFVVVYCRSISSILFWIEGIDTERWFVFRYIPDQSFKQTTDWLMKSVDRVLRRRCYYINSYPFSLSVFIDAGAVF